MTLGTTTARPRPTGWVIVLTVGPPNTIGEMNQQPQRSAGQGGTRDGLAAVAITLLTVSLIILLVTKII